MKTIYSGTKWNMPMMAASTVNWINAAALSIKSNVKFHSSKQLRKKPQKNK